MGHGRARGIYPRARRRTMPASPSRATAAHGQAAGLRVPMVRQLQLELSMLMGFAALAPPPASVPVPVNVPVPVESTGGHFCDAFHAASCSLMVAVLSLQFMTSVALNSSILSAHGIMFEKPGQVLD